MRVYSSPFSSISYDEARGQLTVVWHDRATELDEDGVRNEIGMILELVKQRAVRNILVDTVLYPFRENATIQSWINYTYLPQIMESGIKRYAIVVRDKVNNWYENIVTDEPDGLEIEYFTDQDRAQQWIDA